MKKREKNQFMSIIKKVARELQPLPSPKIFKTKKDYNRQQEKKKIDPE